MLGNTGKFEVHDIVYNKDGFAIARGYWEKSPHLNLACRWHDDGIGYPQTFGKPQWMQLPPNIDVEIIQTLDPNNSRVIVTFGQ
jgi:hypothetical protein